MSHRTILMYHRIAEDPDDPYSLCVSPRHFEDQLRTICETADIVDLDSLMADLVRRVWGYGSRGHARRGRPQVAVTFDDGYADNLLAALPVMQTLGLPMTVYVATSRLDSATGYWWDRLALLLNRRRRVELALNLAGRKLRISLHGDRASATALAALHTRLRLLPVAEIEEALAVIAEQLSTPIPEPQRARVMTREELHTLSANPLVTIGAHTVDHVLLAGRPFAQQVETMTNSKAELESLLDRPVRHFAYPFGDAASFDSASIAAARSSGFDTAATTLAGRVTRFNDHWQLPRRMVHDWSAAEMAAYLSAWRAG